MQLPSYFKRLKRVRRTNGWLCLASNSHGAFVVQLKRSVQKIHVQRCSFYPMENTNSAALGRLVKELHVQDAQFTTLLSPDEYQVLMVDAPAVPAEEQKTAIRYRIKDLTNYDIEQATVDLFSIPGNKNGGNRPQSVYAVVAPNETIKKRMALFEQAELELTVIDIQEMAQRNIAALYETEGRGLAFLSFNEYGGLLTFTCDQELYLARRLEITAGQLQDANYSLRQQFIERVELEVQRSLDYFDRQFHQISLNKMLVNAPLAAGITRLLADNLGMTVETLDLSQVMDISAVPSLADNEFMLDSLPALGAALRLESSAA